MLEIPKPKGIGGWLFLPLYLLIVSMMFLIYLAVATRFHYLVMAAKIRHMALAPNFHEIGRSGAFMSFDWMPCLMMATFLFGLFCFVKFLRKSRATPRLMILWYNANIALNVLLAIQLAASPNLYKKMIVPGADFGLPLLQLVVMSAVSGILVLYFQTSIRVKNTFIK